MKSDFSALKRRILLLFLKIMAITIVLGVLLQYVLIDGIWQEPFARLFVNGVQAVFGISYERAVDVYQMVFLYNKYFWVTAGFCMLLVVCFYFGITKLMKYFQEVSEGVDRLLMESEEVIVLPPELHFMERKLNMIKNTLAKRTREAQEAEQRKNDLVVYLAHDLKTPLTSVIGYLSLLDEAVDMPIEQRAKYVGITLEKAYRLEQLINEFFDITRFNLQTIILERAKIDLKFMLEQMADEFYPIVAPQGKQITVELLDNNHSAENIYVEADADKLARVFNNILKNAVAYGKENSTILIQLAEENKEVVIIFANEGVPIPKMKLDTIFEKFYRLDAARTTNKGGAGLGLAIAKEIVVAHGGSITASSDEQGTKFIVRLPL